MRDFLDTLLHRGPQWLVAAAVLYGAWKTAVIFGRRFVVWLRK